MAKTKFKIIYDLGPLSEEERQQYLRHASEYFQLDPDLNALDLIWMNAEDGLRRLVVYARKGTTDILRDIHGIEITNLTQHDGSGYVSFTATGKNNRRQEMATGTHSIEGLKGEKLASAVMTAQTRALRRLTLQFVGGGILDVSEVNAPTADIAASPASVAQLAGSPMVMPPPQVVPSAAPGKDITPIAPVDMAAHITKVYADGAAALAAMPTPNAEGNFIAVGQPGSALAAHAAILAAKIKTPAPVTPAATPVAVETEVAKKADILEPEAKKKRTYKKRNQVTISSPGQEAPAALGDLQGCATAAVSVSSKQLPGSLQDLVDYSKTPATPPVSLAVSPSTTPVPPISLQTPPVAPAAPVVSVQTSVISKEKQEGYRTRLAKYYVDVLPKGGMLPSEGIGGVTMKMRKFAAVFSGVQEVKQMTEQNWEDLFEFLDASLDPAALVKYINQALGVA